KRELGRGSSDAAGAVSLETETGAWTVVVAAPGWPAVEVHSTVPGSLDVKLPTGSRIRGVVRVDGAPPTEPVEVLLDCDRAIVGDAVEGFALAALDGAGFGDDTTATVADATGAFVFEALPAGARVRLSLGAHFALTDGARQAEGVEVPREDVVLD